MARRRRSDSQHPRDSHPCRVYWGSHGCRKRWPHLGRHLCGSGCWAPNDDFDGLYGEDALATLTREDRRLREAILHAPAERRVDARS